ncbi:MAG: prepilin-type N-terminal cleavage/methylation domain-containing protein, partial [Pseudomonadota bacterium]
MKSRGQAGISLVELLVVLTILSMAAGIAGISISRVLPTLVLRQAASSLEADLQRARTLSLTQVEAVEISFEQGGYTIEKLDLQKILPQDAFVNWSGGETLLFSAGVPNLGGVVSIRKGGREVSIRVEPYTGRVSRH